MRELWNRASGLELFTLSASFGLRLRLLPDLLELESDRRVACSWWRHWPASQINKAFVLHDRASWYVSISDTQNGSLKKMFCCSFAAVSSLLFRPQHNWTTKTSRRTGKKRGKNWPETSFPDLCGGQVDITTYSKGLCGRGGGKRKERTRPGLGIQWPHIIRLFDDLAV